MSVPKLNPARERHWVCAQRLRERRLELRLTQREVAARLVLRGNQMSNRALSAMENGRGLDLGLLPEFAEVLDCTVTYLLGLTAQPQAWQPDGLTPTRPAGNGGPVPVWQAAGILGPGLPEGFAAPRRIRSRPNA